MVSVVSLLTIPFLAAILILMGQNRLKTFALVLSIIPLILLLSGGREWIGAFVDYVWMPNLAIHFSLRVDGLSLLFLYLTALIIPLSLLAAPQQTAVFYGLVLFLQGLLMGFFMAQDLVLFTLFWEAMLLPLYLLISLWGGPKRYLAAFQFLIYMIGGSILMIAAILALYVTERTFDLQQLAQVVPLSSYAPWIGAAFLLAFAVKTPLFPFHGWLPDAYSEASTTGSILLSALLSKAGIYGFFRVGIGLFPALMKEWGPLLVGLALTGVLYAGLAAWRQSDFKRLLAYSSLSHVNFILVGLFLWNQTAQEGALLQAFNHGITITALFLVAGWLQERLGSTALGPSSGLAKIWPTLCWLTLFFVLSSVALPGTNNFVGEVLILFGLFGAHPYLTALLGLTVILSVMYMLRWMQEMYFGKPVFSQAQGLDIRGKELFIALPLILLILWIGIYPAPLLTQIEAATEQLHQEGTS